MQTYGISLEATPPSHLDKSNANEFVDSESGMFSNDTKCAGAAREVETSVKNMSTHCCSYQNEEKASLTVDIPEGSSSSTSSEATESCSILDWLENYGEGKSKSRSPR
ncbi:hypothetical protein OIU78_023232 [Salix suchowensis]|nr:hypothetical protein OIU78_023232 [Salix suchowensis]